MNYPNDVKYTKNHIWISVDGDMAKLGITDFAQDQLGDILFVDLPEVGGNVDNGCVFSEVESSKTSSELISPVTGEITAVNEELDDSPECINDDPYEAWIIEVRIDENSEIENLLSAEEYETFCAEQE